MNSGPDPTHHDDKPAGGDGGSNKLIAGRYRVEALLGEGGMGAVYRARDEQQGVTVALKRLHAGSERAKVALFEQEFFTLAELAHPRIIEVYEYGVDAGRAHYTMELLDGADLRDHKKQLDWQTVCAVLCDVACSLGILHSRGLLHRDVSPRNVRRTADGRAKLIDFGAMARMGISKELVGTPPCVAPEVLHGIPCDGRADLYALGVVGYWLLTGRYAYPARTFAELLEVWSSPTLPVQQLAPGVPATLAELIGELISLDPNGRPRTAGEVVERLSAIGGFELADAETFAGAYLSSPKLVGRDGLLSWSRSILREVSEGRGKVMMVEGDVGTGLTRALNACASEAKRLGAVVVTASAGDAAGGEYGIVRALVGQLTRAVPGAGSLLRVQDRALLEHLLSARKASDAPPPERGHVQVALRDWLIAVSGERRLVIVVDDVDRADEPSLSLLAMLAERLKKLGIAIVMARHRDAGAGLPLEVLSRLAETFHLEPLPAAETEDLVRSVFGDVGNVMRVAQTVHERARGNPRDVMAYLANLVERGAARYERAAWVLSDTLDGTDVPSSIGAALEARFLGMDPDAQQLARALALTDPSWLGIQDYGHLVGLPGAAVFKALGALVSSRILVEEGSGHCFVGRVAPAWLQSSDLPWVATVHARLAELAASRGEPFRRLHHLIESGQAALAIHEMVNVLGTERLDYTARSVDLIERALAATRGQPIPELQLLELRLRLVGVSAMIGNLATFRRCAPGEMARLRRDSALDDWEALGPELAPGERLQMALSRANERYATTPEPQRGFSPFEAIKRLVRLCTGFMAMAGTASDKSILDEIPSLAPLGVLSPAIALIDASTTALRWLESGRVVKSRAAFAELLQRLASLDGLELGHREQLQYSWMYVAGTIDATNGLPSALEFAAELDKAPKYRSGAWHMRRSYYRMLGSFEKARGCQREMELLELRDGPQTFKSANFRIELAASTMSDDVVGLKSLAIAVDAAAVRLPRLRALAQLSRAHFHRMRGEYAQALECLSPILEFAEPGSSIDWVSTASSHVDLLALNGRVEDALAYAERYRNASNPEEHSGTELEAAWALALAVAGRVEEAESVCDGIIQLEERRGTRGLRLARCFQVRARIALARGDNDAFTLWANRFAEFCGSTESSALRAQANRLLREGRAAGVGDLREIELPTTRMEASDNVGTIATRLSSCGDRTERARLALSLALETFGADSGHLFGVQGNGMERLVSFPDQALPDGLAADLDALVARERAEQDETQYMEVAGDQPEQREENPKSGAYRLRPLYSDSDGGLALVGALALSEERAGEGTKRSAGGGASSPSRTLQVIADALAENGDVDRITSVG